MKIKEFSLRTGWSIDTIRFYETKGLLTPERAAGSGYRIFSEEDVELAEAIEIGRQLGFGLREIAESLEQWRAGELTTDRKLNIVRAKLGAVEDRLAQLNVIKGSLLRKQQKLMEELNGSR